MVQFDIPAECPRCGATFSVPRIRAGRQEPCPVCRAEVLVPALAEAEEGEAPDGEVRYEQQQEEPATAAEVQQLPADVSGPVVVCVATERKLNPMALGELIAEFAGIPVTGGRQRVVRSKGLLMEGLTVEAGERLIEALAERGVEAFMVPAAWVPRPQALNLTRIYDADQEALHVQVDAEGAIRPLPWRLLAAGACVQSPPAAGREPQSYGEEAMMPAVAPGIGFGVIRRRRRMTYGRRDEPEMRVMLFFCGRRGGVYELAFGERQVRYPYLGERVRPTAGQNFVLVLRDVMGQGGRAFFPASFSAAAEGRRVGVTKVTGKLESENYRRWVLCCAARRGLLTPQH